MEPGILIYSYATVIRAGGDDLIEIIDRGFRVKGDLAVVRGDVAAFREHPNLKKFHRFLQAVVFLTVGNTGAGTHGLNVALADDRSIAHRILVPEVTGEGNRDDLHIVVRMFAEAAARGHVIIVQHPERSEVHPFRVVVTSKAEGVITL